MSVIKESYVLSADDSDVLAAPSRLAAMPADGILTLEISSTVSDGATNYGTVTLQLPSGETPFENLVVPYNGYSGTQNTIHDDTAIVVQIEVEAGGHVLLSYDETGTTQTVVFATLTF